MKLFRLMLRFFLRFRYPGSLPTDISSDLGVTSSHYLSFDQLIETLTRPDCKISRLTKFMSRESAEAVFQSALRKEKFNQNTLISYYFPEGWLEFVLSFDNQSRLRRVYLQHKRISAENGREIPLNMQTH